MKPTKLEQALSKKSLALLDAIRQQRGIHTRAKALETLLLEASRDEQQIMPWDEIVPTGTYKKSYGQIFKGNATPFQTALAHEISQIIATKSADFAWQKYLFVQGYEECEIEKFEGQFEFRFPKMYREFLGVIGKPPENVELFHEPIFGGSISLHLVRIERQNFSSYLEFFEGVPPPLENNIIFYLNEESTWYEYFVAEGDDPRVFHFNWYEGIIDLECTFSERILQILTRQLDFSKHGIPKSFKSKSEIYFV
jgi:hypothetical protein